MFSVSGHRGPISDLTTDRLVLRLIATEDAAAVLDGRRLPQWAADFPALGDLEAARLPFRVGAPTGADRVLGHRLVVERGSGYATEAVIAMLGHVSPSPRSSRWSPPPTSTTLPPFGCSTRAG